MSLIVTVVVIGDGMKLFALLFFHFNIVNVVTKIQL